MCVLRGLFSPHGLIRETDFLRLERNIPELRGVEAGEKVFSLQHTEIYREREMPPGLSPFLRFQNFQGFLRISVAQDVTESLLWMSLAGRHASEFAARIEEMVLVES